MRQLQGLKCKANKSRWKVEAEERLKRNEGLERDRSLLRKRMCIAAERDYEL